MFFDSLWGLLAGIPAILLAIAFHEFAHGKTAAILGDPTPYYQGRLTLNPIKHLDLIGALMLLIAGFGWAKPVQVNPMYFKMDRRKGMMLVGIAGPAMNIVLAYFSVLLIRIFPFEGFLRIFLHYSLWFNTMLAVFNLIPIPPLDGSKILAGILPPRYLSNFYALEQYGPFILLLLLVTGLIGSVLRPGIEIVITILSKLAGYSIF